ARRDREGGQGLQRRVREGRLQGPGRELRGGRDRAAPGRGHGEGPGRDRELLEGRPRLRREECRAHRGGREVERRARGRAGHGGADGPGPEPAGGEAERQVRRDLEEAEGRRLEALPRYLERGAVEVARAGGERASRQPSFGSGS